MDLKIVEREIFKKSKFKRIQKYGCLIVDLIVYYKGFLTFIR